MSTKSKDEIIASIRKVVGENNSDEVIALVEDVSDTLDDYEARTADTTNWKTKYDEVDAMWRKKYMDRFSGKTGEEIKDEQEEQIKDDSEPRTFDELFKEREGK